MPPASDVVVRTDRLTKSYGRLVALREVDLRIERGEVFGYLGPNGAGKSTTLRVLMGMLRPTAGRAELFGMDAWSAAVAVHRRVGYVPGELALYPRMTGRSTSITCAICAGTATGSTPTPWRPDSTCSSTNLCGHSRKATGRSSPWSSPS